MSWDQQKFVVLALAISLVCGGLAQWAGLPLPWMLGPMIGNTIAAMLGVPIEGPDRLRPVVIPIIGVMLGSSVTLALFAQLGQWLLTLILLPLFLAVAAGLSYGIYRRLGRYDPVTAYYAAMPGGLNEMLMLGGAAGGDEKRIALAHAARVLIVIFFVVIYFWLVLGVTSTGTARWIAMHDLSLPDYTILGICAVVGLWGGKFLKLPAAPIFGPMILSGIAHIAGWITVAPPTILIVAAQFIIGTVIGSRFVGVAAVDIIKDLSLAALSAAGMLAIAVVFAEVIVWQTGMGLSQAFLAYAPGGLTEMSLLALAMDQDIAYVSLMHLIRITLVIGTASFIFKSLAKTKHSH